jgi:UDP-N-acetylmuramoyl-L-alanyl-D-glutamate--2,6-diaminopimelate ligase
MDDYFKSKKLLFDRASDKSIAIVNNEDIYCDEIIKDYKGKIIRYGNKGDYEYEVISNSLNGVAFKIDNEIINSTLLFKTNIYNLVVAYLVLKHLGFDTSEIRESLARVHVINGRSEVLYNKGFYIILDYAHTPDAMERILLEVNRIKENRVITLFGCGGNRDKSKRKIMGYISTLNSDRVYISNDNPRFENEDDIISDIISISDKEKITIIKDREKAINEAINELENGDVLLILGKGHEEYQIIKDKKYHLSDREIVTKCLEN